MVELDENAVVVGVVRLKGLHYLCPLRGDIWEHGGFRNKFQPLGKLPKREPLDL